MSPATASRGRGYPAKTRQRVAEAVRLREAGLTYAEIATRLNIAPKTAYGWVSDPDGAKSAARKRRYAGVCDTCGGPTNGSNGPGSAPARCQECINWTRDAVLLALGDWFEEHGSPPRGADAIGSGRLPTQTSVERLFGGWNAALEAAGLPIARERRPEVWEEVRRRWLAGATVRELADQRGCTPQNIYQHLQRHGIWEPRPRPRPRRWSREAMIDAMRRWQREHDQTPTSGDWQRPGAHPTYHTVRRHFGSWGAALEAAFDRDINNEEEISDARGAV